LIKSSKIMGINGFRGQKSETSCAKVSIHVWYACVDCSFMKIREFGTLLSTEETARAQRFRSAHDCDRYIVQHGVLRSLLSGYVGCAPRIVDIRTSANGKPYMAGRDQAAIHFNASQSEAFAAFAFSRTGSIGVDIEKMREIPDMLEIVERHFTPREKHAIFSRPESLRSGLFYKLWTRKEAVLKAQGEGLLRPLDCVDVTTSGDANGPWKVQVAGELVVEDFWVMDVNGPEGFATAVASAGPFAYILVRQVGEEIISNIHPAADACR
jgi:4'-phosphopantetheinyl transferase